MVEIGLCLSPLSPFRFSLQTSPSPDCRSPVFASPAKSPVRRKFEDNEQEGSMGFQVEEEDEEDREQNSPVSVLDPPFEDDGYDGHEYSYTFVQRAKQHLLHKLHRFEKLAELDPIELEKRLIEDEDEGQTDYIEDLGVVERLHDFQEYEYESYTFDEQKQMGLLIEEISEKSGLQDVKTSGIKRLVSDLIFEEENEEIPLDIGEQLVKRVCKRLESWKEVESNTIDMMVEMDLMGERTGEWKNPQEQYGEVTRDIEVAILGVLVEELLGELINYA